MDPNDDTELFYNNTVRKSFHDDLRKLEDESLFCDPKVRRFRVKSFEDHAPRNYWHGEQDKDVSESVFKPFSDRDDYELHHKNRLLFSDICYSDQKKGVPFHYDDVFEADEDEDYENYQYFDYPNGFGVRYGPRFINSFFVGTSKLLSGIRDRILSIHDSIFSTIMNSIRSIFKAHGADSFFRLSQLQTAILSAFLLLSLTPMVYYLGVCLFYLPLGDDINVVWRDYVALTDWDNLWGFYWKNLKNHYGSMTWDDTIIANIIRNLDFDLFQSTIYPDFAGLPPDLRSPTSYSNWEQEQLRAVYHIDKVDRLGDGFKTLWMFDQGPTYLDPVKIKLHLLKKEMRFEKTRDAYKLFDEHLHNYVDRWRHYQRMFSDINNTYYFRRLFDADRNLGEALVHAITGYAEHEETGFDHKILTDWGSYMKTEGMRLKDNFPYFYEFYRVGDRFRMQFFNKYNTFLAAEAETHRYEAYYDCHMLQDYKYKYYRPPFQVLQFYNSFEDPDGIVALADLHRDEDHYHPDYKVYCPDCLLILTLLGALGDAAGVAYPGLYVLLNPNDTNFTVYDTPGGERCPVDYMYDISDLRYENTFLQGVSVRKLIYYNYRLFWKYDSILYREGMWCAYERPDNALGSIDWFHHSDKPGGNEKPFTLPSEKKHWNKYWYDSKEVSYWQ